LLYQLSYVGIKKGNQGFELYASPKQQ